MTIEEIQTASEQDVTIQALRHEIRTNRWYENPLVQPYHNIRTELSDIDGIVMRGERIVLPESLRLKAMKIAHEGHLGIEKCKSLLRMKVYWPKMQADMERFISNCNACKANSKANAPEPLHPSELPEAVWSEISIDFYGPVPTGEKLFVVIDLYSRFPLVEVMKTTNAEATINRLKKHFALYGYPTRLRSDNGPPFNSAKFREYLDDCGIKHVKITPFHPKANATVERFMQVINKCVKTATYTGHSWKEQLDTTLRQYRSAAHATTGQSPSSLFFNRQLNTKLPAFPKTNEKDVLVRSRQERLYEKAKVRHDKKTRAKECDVEVGDHVIAKKIKTNKLSSAYSKTLYKVIRRNKSLVEIEDENGNRITRNVTLVKKVKGHLDVEPKKHSEVAKTYPKRDRKTVEKFEV